MCHSLVSTSQLCAAINPQVVLRDIKFCNNFTKGNIFCYLWLIRRPRRSKLGFGQFSFGRHEYISTNNDLQLEGWRDRSHIRAPPMPDSGKSCFSVANILFFLVFLATNEILINFLRFSKVWKSF